MSPAFAPPPEPHRLPEAEERVLAFWRDQSIFQASLERPAPRGHFVFFEGPPTANNRPHIGHALTRAVKDVVPRFRTMQGFHVARRAGWDTHGLPVEISIERELGFQDKGAIEAYGIERFNDRCWTSVRKYERDWVAASERLGFWLDYDQAYFTFTNKYIESVWWILSQMFEAGMLVEGQKVLPYCPLCGTTHSSHEVAQAYKDVKDPSVTAAFRLMDGQARGGIDLGDVHVLAWTTTPWTLPSNMALCVHPQFQYKLIESAAFPGRRYLLADGLAGPAEELVAGKPVDLRATPALATFLGSELVGLRYEPLFAFTGTDTDALPRPESEGAWVVTADPYVTLDSGTGVVHVAPAFGEDDHRVGQREGLPRYCALDLAGRFRDHTGALAGQWFKDGDELVIADLKARGLLVRSQKVEHSYPHCWRHGTPLYYFATSSWFVRTTAMKERMLVNNQKIRWSPEHIGEGRFGNWLEGVVDWALSRKRYWGTPLPIWRCGSCGATECLGSYAALYARWGRELPADPYDRDCWNPHRPYVDDIEWDCRACDGRMRRVVEVIDCWFDAGAMPFAQAHYPFDEAAAREIDEGRAFPADFISEAVDQTRGWFYTLHVIATFLKDSPAFKSCIVLGHVLDEQGRKMSKNLGNVVDPAVVIDQVGADAFRWFFYRSNPTAPSRFGTEMVKDSLRTLMLPLLSSWSFFCIYANLDGFDPAASRPAFAVRKPLDRYILSELQSSIERVTASLTGNDLPGATQAVEAFVEKLTNWYIRRSRRRFWKEVDDLDKAAAHSTLWEVLATLSRLLAPFLPFLAEQLHRDLVLVSDPEAPRSVHLADWPVSDPGQVDETVVRRMEAARRVVTLGHAARADAALGVRQPLRLATVVSVDPAVIEALADPDCRAIVADELNVKELRLARDRSVWVDAQVKPNFRTLGKRLGKRMPWLQQALQALPAQDVVHHWERDHSLDLVLQDGEVVRLSGDDLEVRIQQKEGTVSSHDDVALVALDTALDEALVLEGLAREVVNRLQARRRDLDLPFDARVVLRWDASPGLRAALEVHRVFICEEVLAIDFVDEPGLQGDVVDTIRGESFSATLDPRSP